MRSLFLVGWVAVLGVSLAAGRLWSGTRPTAARSRVGLVNLHQVVMDYERRGVFQPELDALQRSFADKETAFRKEVNALTEERSRLTTSIDRKAAIEKELKNLQGRMGDHIQKGQNALEEKQVAQLTSLYRDVRKVVQGYAAAHDLDLVLCAGGLWVTEKESWSPYSIRRSVPTDDQCCKAMWSRRGVDITADIITLLRDRRSGK